MRGSGKRQRQTSFGPRASLLLAALLALGNLASECTDEDEDSCDLACEKLRDCEAAWLEDEGQEPMTAAQRVAFWDDCMKDCEKNAEPVERECIYDATCDEILDGECSR
jgi:hypothetical protein